MRPSYLPLAAAALALAGCSTADRSRDAYPAATPAVTVIREDRPARDNRPPDQEKNRGPGDPAWRDAPRTDGSSSPRNGSSSAQPNGSGPPSRNASPGSQDGKSSSADAGAPPDVGPPPTRPTDVKKEGERIDTTHGPANPPPPVIPDAGARPL